jgi:sulfite reductase (NADPH) hemoprotein beta-component/sulfite reductase (ferredoxin)
VGARLTAPDRAATVRRVDDRDGATTREAIVVDVRGVACPLAWAKAKVRLEALPRGTSVEVVIDDARSLRDLPRAAEASGHHVTSIDDAGPPWRVRLEV